MRSAWAGTMLLLLVLAPGCASGIPTRLETQVRHHYTCGLGTISGHLLSRTEDSETYAVEACGGHHLVAVCPTGGRRGFQPCSYESDTGGEGSEVVYGPPRHVDEPPARADAGPPSAEEPPADEPPADEPTTAEEDGPDAAPPTPPASPGPTAEAAARAAVDAHRAALLACTGGPAALRLSWSAEGQLTATLRDARDSDEERCVQAAMAGVTIDAGGTAGTALHAIAP